MRNKIHIPELSLVVLVGTSGSGKSTFAKQNFLPTETVSSDYCRGIVSDDENSMEATGDAFELAHYIIKKRLKRGNLTVVDATNVQADARKPLLQIAKEFHTLPVAIVLNIDKKICQERNVERPDRNFGGHVIRNQHSQLKRSLRQLKREGFRYIHVINSPEEIEQIEIVKDKLWNNKKHITGPFDIIGDVHGCFTELKELLEKLDYKITKHKDRDKNYGYTVSNPADRKAIFVGDLVDRGPASNEVLRLVMSMVKNDQAYVVCGNHDSKLYKKLIGRNVQIKHGLAETLEQLENEPQKFIDELKTFLDKLISHYVFDDGKLVVAHAGLKEEMQGRGSGAVRSFCMYGDTTGEIDEFGLPVRLDWAKDYKGKAMVVYGHTPVPEAEWLNKTIDIDTGCVFGGKLTALRYPERELVEVKANKAYAESKKPLVPETNNLSAQHENDDIIDIKDVSGKRHIKTKYNETITIREEHSIAALEVMSRFAVNPKWLAYLPPTMSPSETSTISDYLEHPEEAIKYYQSRGVHKIVCEEKHMGSRAVFVVGKDENTIAKGFGITGEGIGKIYTRTGRDFFTDLELEQAILRRFRDAMNQSDFWNTFSSDWAIFDCELMPWSAKAMQLIEDQYAAVGSAGEIAIKAISRQLENGVSKHPELNDLLNKTKQHSNLNAKFRKAYNQYCWDVKSIEDYKIAPFHLLATEGKVHTDKDHQWHMDTIADIAIKDSLLIATPYKVIHLDNKKEIMDAIDWWVQLTEKGGEGMVVKPFEFITKGKKGLIQPAIKCRGKEYLRIIYGADYDTEQNLKNLRNRGLSKKRSMAIKEFSLGLEALDRFVNKAPLRDVHECVFGVLAMESEPVDPRL
ncbi:polynucleotide kinase-phosphatase [uncultured Aquimarina sp.]|uniref:polynucleotide kinase-phosphatase n=1 Tax=uncultured Aquimarina sp. TaxID=575652 RepID=UPI00260613D1|nr:polynucleotide kinase-phosphatase [uncultured Aquimarina sp.]